jgi:3-hydroxybutyryl-CoA dehydratase
MLTTARGALPTTPYQALCFEDLALGQRAALTRVVTEADIQDVAEIGWERSPVRLGGAHADRTRFGQRIAHGLFTAGLVTALLGTRLPGPGAVYLSQSLQYLGPVALGDAVTASVEVVELVAARRRARLFCECLVDGRAVLEGEAWVAVPGRG